MSISKFFSFRKKNSQEHKTPPPSNIPPEYFKLDAIMEDGETVSIEQCSNQEFLLESLLENNIDVGYGCSNGVCGKCKVKLVSGTLIEEERIGLTKEEIAHNYVLICKSKPTSDVVIDYR